MATSERIQTAFRLSPELLARVKRAARKENVSVNLFVERTLDKATEPVFPKLPRDFPIDDDILSLAVVSEFRPFTKEELEADPKLACLVKKNNL
ncbi:MAG: toxin-antitoxin system HicB family antitoxin [Bacteroidales bacterium]|nr:toxin-antitoxin system HicB family antitoxin [Bacteroidales bacterium]